MTEPILVAKSISKQFPGVKALDEINFELIPGEVHAIVGENGAGKSTLIKIFAGLHKPTSGSIELNGNAVHFDNPMQAQHAGISVITQEFNLIPQLTVAENIFLNREPVHKYGLVDWKTIRQKSADILRDLGLNVSPTLRVEYLSVADQQLVEVAKALSREFSVIIMDEPTAALNSAEVERLFEIIANLRQRGVAVIYVSHRLAEIFRIADRVTVLRDGKMVNTRPTKELNENDIITMMLGRELEKSNLIHEEMVGDQKPALSVKELSVPGALHDVSFDLHYGEVLGCAGLVGSGRSELMRALFGMIPQKKGEISIDGVAKSLQNPIAALEAGIFMLPEDRKIEGLFPDLSVLENLLVNRKVSGDPEFQGLMITGKHENEKYQEVRDFLKIRAHSSEQLISTLSGGNQQKVLLGRALVSKSRILLLNEPTRGVDVGTKVEIHDLIRQLAKDGHAVIVSSSDVPELVNVSDRCLVLSGGQLHGLLPRTQINEDNILAYAVGHIKKGG